MQASQQTSIRTRFQRTWLPLLALALLCCGTGCVQRRLIVRSNPPGALVYVDNFEIGTTPVGVNFTYYGTRQVRLVKDGYETVTDYVKVAPPWYQYFPLDFVSENLVPATIRDQRMLVYTLQPQRLVPAEELIQRADQLRQSAQSGAPLPPIAPPPPDNYLPPTAEYRLQNGTIETR